MKLHLMKSLSNKSILGTGRFRKGETGITRKHLLLEITWNFFVPMVLGVCEAQHHLMIMNVKHFTHLKVPYKCQLLSLIL